jgi:quinoprotein glucose dehydrogenase
VHPASRFRHVARAAVLSLAAAGCARSEGATPRQRQSDPAGEWAAYGRDALGTRYSPLAQITRDNVARLQVAWTFHTGEATPALGTTRKTSLETTPLVVDGTMFLTTPLGRVIALDPATGRERWRFDAQVNREGRFGDFTNRGVSYWMDRGPGAPAEGQCRRRVFIGTIDGRLIALDAGTGTPCASFGAGGTIDLKPALRNKPSESYVEEFEITSPPAVVNGTIVIGSAIADNGRADAASGEVRAFDARTGRPRWTWDPVPQDSTDPAYGSWRGPRAHTTGAANAWSVIAADAERDLVFIPTGSASPDYYGGERLGDNRYANSIVALRVSTGKVVWHFQTVHHDLWDYDNASPPALVTVEKDGRRIPVVLQATKTGQLYVLDRETGRPVYPIEERPVPASDIPGEESSPTQPFNTVIPPLSPQTLAADGVWGPSPADIASCRERIRALRNDGTYTPPSERGTLVYPSSIGGAHWGGVAFDPLRQIAVIPTNRIAIEVKLIPRAGFDRSKLSPQNEPRGPEPQYTNMRGTPYVMRRQFIFGPSGLPCTPPPFGALVAIDLRTGRKLWEVPLGGLAALAGDSAPEAVKRQLATAGAPNLGGPIATAGGLVFIGAALDGTFRAFDIETGRELWHVALPASAKATPMTYRLTPNGPQYVVVAAGGDGGSFGTSDAVIAYAIR